MWISLTCLSALFLGFYDLAKKKAVDGNAVLPTLFCTTLAGALCMAPLLLLSRLWPEAAMRWHVYISPQPLTAHLLIVAKSGIVGVSWLLSYFALKHLPITVASPLRATGPLFTVAGAVLLFGERLRPAQALGITLILGAYFLYSAQGLAARKREKDKGKKNASHHPDRPLWIALMILAALTGAVSSGFDKYLLQTRQLPNLFVLGYFLPYLAVMFGIIAAVLWYPRRNASKNKDEVFRFRPAMVGVGVLLVAADFAYFTALAHPGAKLAVVSAIRRSNVIVSFAGGMLLFREGESRRKLTRQILPFIGILAGLALLLVE
jgi:bacterial/archaeal transporter family protein